MSLLFMGFAGSILIIATMLIRFFTVHKVPRWVLLAFWYVALVRLLVPYSLPSVFSVFAPLGKVLPKTLPSSEAPSLGDVSSVLRGVTAVKQPLASIDPSNIVSYVAIPMQDSTALESSAQTLQATSEVTTTIHTLDISAEEAGSALFPDGGTGFNDLFASLVEGLQSTVDVWAPIWVVGSILCAVAFALIYWRSHRKFRESLPIDNEFVAEWISQQRLRRPLQVRSSDQITTPVSYGVFRPVILLPKTFDWSNRQGLVYVLTHECMHIRHFDSVTKLLIIAAVCLYWFNPLVWAMYVLANRDIEFATDAAVIRRCGTDARSSYALTLISMAEAKSSPAPLCNHFSKNVIEERITAVMTMKKTPWISLAVSAVLLTGTTMAFATTPQTDSDDASTPSVSAEPLLSADDGDLVAYQVFEDGKGGRVVTLKDTAVSDGDEPALVYSFNDGTNLVPIETTTAITDEDVVWWTADEYEKWLEQEKKDLQECLGYKAWTSSKGWFVWTQDLIDEAIAQYEDMLDDIKNGAKVSKPFAIETSEDGTVSSTAIFMESMPSTEAAYAEGDGTVTSDDDMVRYMITNSDGSASVVSSEDDIQFSYVTKTDSIISDDAAVSEESVLETDATEMPAAEATTEATFMDGDIVYFRTKDRKVVPTELSEGTVVDDSEIEITTNTAEARELSQDEVLSLRAQAKALEIFGEADALEMNVDSEGTPAYFKKFEPFDVSVEWVDGGLDIYYKSALVNAFIDDRPDGGYTTIGSKTPGGETDVKAVYDKNGKLIGVEEVEHQAESHWR